MQRRACHALGVAFVAASLCCSATARAQGEDRCPTTTVRGPLEATPAVGAPGVTIDAPVLVRYSSGYFGPDGPGDPPERSFALWRCEDSPVCAPCTAEEGTPVAGRVAAYGDVLTFVPDVEFSTNGRYAGVSRGVDRQLNLLFCTGGRRDEAPPILGAITQVSPLGVGPSCELPEGGYRITFFAEAPLDDGPPGSLEYLLYLTRGPGVNAPVLRDRFRNAGGVAVLLLRLAPDEGHEPVCARIALTDGVGNVTMGEEEHCIDPITAASFEGCAVGNPAGAQWPIAQWPIVVALAALVGRGLRRRRTRRA